MEAYQEAWKRWMDSSAVSEEEKEQLRAMEHDDALMRERFSAYLSFGTAGLRGIMSPGTNAMNVHTVRHATQGLAAFILGQDTDGTLAGRGVVIACDSRNHSTEFAQAAACVLAGNGIRVYLFDALRPTPELSFAVRELHCIAGINITASHNPAAYNGYKAYWEDGAQLAPEQADAVSACIAATDLFNGIRTVSYDAAVADKKIELLGQDFDERYMAAVISQQVNPQTVLQAADSLCVVYTPLHGAGCRITPEVLRRIGVKKLYTVPEQMKPDGNFPTAPNPNPEFPAVFEPGLRLADEVGADLIIANDPDADRTGAMIRGKDGKYTILTGNQIGALLVDYIICDLEERNAVPPHPYVVKSIVSSELVTRICEAHHVKIHNVLTGFKYIGEVIKNYEKQGYGDFIFGYEESYGFLKGTYCRDKDAVVASMLLTEMAAYYKLRHIDLRDALDRLYERYGCFREATDSITMEGLDGSAKMARLMDSLRAAPPASLGGEKIREIRDYQLRTVRELDTGKQTDTGLPPSNVLYFTTTTGNVIVLRPSGTEPKLKIYYLLRGESWEGIDRTLSACRADIQTLVKQ